MSRIAQLNLRDPIRAIRERYEAVHLPAIERERERLQRLPEGSLKGQGRQFIVEAQVRQYLIDPILESFGWETGSTERMVVEDAANPQQADEGRKFLDYHGRETTEDNEGRSLLILEAKRASVSLPGPAGCSSIQLANEISRALVGIARKQIRINGFTQEWLERFRTLSEYVKSTRETYGASPSRAILTNGEWYIVFCRPENALMGMSSPDGEIIVFANLEEVEARINDFYPHFAYAALSEKVPVQHPFELRNFVQKGADIRVALALEMHVTDYSRIQPTMAVRIFARVRTTTGAWITFRKDYDPKLEVLPGKVDGVLDRRRVLDAHAVALLQEFSAHANVTLLTPAQIEQLDEEDDRKHVLPSRPLCKVVDAKHYILYLGDSPLHINENLSHDACLFHAHENCKRTGDATPDQPILEATINPPAYFASGSIFHCAHKVVHVMRAERCVIAPFEQHMCCRRCAYMERCWSNDLEKQLPCLK